MGNKISLDIHLASLHVGGNTDLVKQADGTPGYNENNLGLGLQYALSDSFSAVGGFYHNSFGETSLYTGLAFAKPATDKLKLGVMGGVADYKDQLKDSEIGNTGLTPIAQLTAQFSLTDQMSITLGLIPGEILEKATGTIPDDPAQASPNVFTSSVNIEF